MVQYLCLFGEWARIWPPQHVYTRVCVRVCGALEKPTQRKCCVNNSMYFELDVMRMLIVHSIHGGEHWATMHFDYDQNVFDVCMHSKYKGAKYSRQTLPPCTNSKFCINIYLNWKTKKRELNTKRMKDAKRKQLCRKWLMQFYSI